MLSLSATAAEAIEPALPLATNLLQLERFGEDGNRANCVVKLCGVVAWAAASGDQFILQDDSGVALIEVGPEPQMLEPGDQVVVEGLGTAGGIGTERRLGPLVLVDNDGVHSMQEKSATVALAAGKHPLRVDWFGRDDVPALEVGYEGPELPRARLPNKVLWRPVLGTGWTNGLEFQAYEGEWWQLPAFGQLIPTKKGFADNFDVALRSRSQFAALSFSSWLEIPRDGRYTFSVASDGGSRLQLYLLQVKKVGKSARLKPLPMVPGQILSPAANSQWAALEGTVTFAGRTSGRNWDLELSSPTARVRVRLAESLGVNPALLANCRLRATGICYSALGRDGQETPTAVWVPEEKLLHVLAVPAELWGNTPLVQLGELERGTNGVTDAQLLRVRGRLQTSGNETAILDDGTGRLAFLSIQPLPTGTNELLEALGVCCRTESRPAWQCLFWRTVQDASGSAGELPLLTSVEEVKHLKRTEALRGYPVHVRGTITWSAGSAVVIQDSTAAIFVSQVPVADADGIRAGEYWEITGKTFAQFSPMLLANQVKRLRLAPLPEPLRPTWDQLLNGSLDTEFVELRGLVTSLRSNTFALLMPGGTISLSLPETRPEELRTYDGALVRARGCLWATKDETTHIFKVGQVELHNASLAVEQPAPKDPFAAPRKHPAELLLYDPQAGAFQRVSVGGQLIRAIGPEYYLVDGSDGLRFQPKETVALEPGDEVEVAGFPELGARAPVLKEAVVRRTGRAALPEPTVLTEENFLSGRFDSTRVRVRARLIKLSGDLKEQALGLQTGARSFVARLNAPSPAVRHLRLGSLLELTGVYAGRGGDRSTGGDVDSFELLVNGPADFKIIAQPPWWTLSRLLGIVAVLATVLGLALVWIGLLRRQVEQRTVELKVEIQERQQAEHQRAVEAERSRIARDLHDDLGASLTEISLLADAGSGSPASLEKASQRFRTIGDKARAVVKALDVIVWLVNPRKDVLPFLASYLASYTEEYLSASGLECRVKIPRDLPAIRVTAEVRHSLFLAVKESLRNIVSHAHASEVLMELTTSPGQLKLVIADNGRGFDYRPGLNGNGLSNLHERLASIGGRCDIVSEPESGTRISMLLPLNSSEAKNL